ncbi:hypothetical protein JJC00_18660 [Bradyrhizobium diazoefficiens]|uniref:hypothetical protein n=1 Tax=Bradyrhizobium diazoefficiens TaxID=1355477 RepID=UPI00190BA269|nr:hypothetical protein [Bradyrhizobium diazoefficiens]QQO37451.1 hypothetical protein JJC00_18660 [Bradyrhizobium diazoefficiens]
MAYKYQFGKKARERLFSREQFTAHIDGRGEHPICPHCDLPVTPDQAWDECHIAVPKALGGNRVGVGHRKCNQEHNNKVDTPMVARVKRKRDRHLNISGPGLGRNPMRCGRRSPWKARIGGGIVPRTTLAQAHKQLQRDRYFVEVEDFSEPLEVQP